jgi:hypothetical protein
MRPAVTNRLTPRPIRTSGSAVADKVEDYVYWDDFLGQDKWISQQNTLIQLRDLVRSLHDINKI